MGGQGPFRGLDAPHARFQYSSRDACERQHDETELKGGRRKWREWGPLRRMHRDRGLARADPDAPANRRNRRDAGRQQLNGWLAHVPTKPPAVADHVLRDPHREIGELQLVVPAAVPFEAALL
jgi:hypothetical protein